MKRRVNWGGFPEWTNETLYFSTWPPWTSTPQKFHLGAQDFALSGRSNVCSWRRTAKKGEEGRWIAILSYCHDSWDHDPATANLFNLSGWLMKSPCDAWFLVWWNGALALTSSTQLVSESRGSHTIRFFWINKKQVCNGASKSLVCF